VITGVVVPVATVLDRSVPVVPRVSAATLVTVPPEPVADSVPPAKATPIDTTGAGDMYAAGVLYGLLHGRTPEEAGRLGAETASRVISQMGARLAQREIDAMKSAVLK
jgi:sugar/nucleoside kinase (ribokinase family)